MTAQLPSYCNRVQYSPGVLIGEWFEEKELQEAEKQFILQKLNRNELLIQSSRTLMHKMCKPVQLEALEYVSFDYPIQLKAPLTKHICKHDALYLSGYVPEYLIHKGVLDFKPSSILRLSPESAPVIRNTFYLRRQPSTVKVLRVPVMYNEPFYIEINNGSEGPPLFLGCAPETNGNFDHHEHYSLYLTYELSAQCRWHIQYADKRKGESKLYDHPVRINSPIVIKNLSVDRNLSVEGKHLWQTLFGIEYEVSCHTYKDPCGKLLYANVFQVQSAETHQWKPTKKYSTLG